MGMLKQNEVILRNALQDNPNGWHKLVNNKITFCCDPHKITLREILNDNQFKVIKAALDYGFFNYPRRISMNELSKKIGLSTSTVCVHFHKALCIIFAEMVISK